MEHLFISGLCSGSCHKEDTFHKQWKSIGKNFKTHNNLHEKTLQ